MTTKAKSETQIIQSESSPYKYFTMMLNMAEDDLNPHEYRLLAHYVRWSGHGGTHQESVRAIAKTTRMGKTTIDKTRDKLEAKGYIKVTKPTDDERKEGVATQVLVLDRWSENINRYAKGVPSQVHGVDPNRDTGVPNQVQTRVPNQVDSEERGIEEPFEEQKDSMPIGTQTPAIPEPITAVVKLAEDHINKNAPPIAIEFDLTKTQDVVANKGFKFNQPKQLLAKSNQADVKRIDKIVAIIEDSLPDKSDSERAAATLSFYRYWGSKIIRGEPARMPLNADSFGSTWRDWLSKFHKQHTTNTSTDPAQNLSIAVPVVPILLQQRTEELEPVI